MTLNILNMRMVLSMAVVATGAVADAQETRQDPLAKPRVVAAFSPVDGKTCVVSLKLEGTRVEKGDLVCELDPAAVKAKVAEQSKKVEDAEAIHKNAVATREDAEMGVADYLEGPFKQDLQTVQGEIALGETDVKRATERLDWSTKMTAKGFLKQDTKAADERTVAVAKFRLEQAQSRKSILVKYTKQKATKLLIAEVEKARADELNKLAELELARDLKSKLTQQVEGCKIIAPIAGHVIYGVGIEESADVTKGALVFRVVAEEKAEQDQKAEQDKEAPKPKAQDEKSFEKEITIKVKLNYLLFLPEGYDSDKGKQWPLMLFLHGAGESGDNLTKVKAHGPPKIVESKKDFPFILVSPQSPGRGWNADTLSALLDEVKKSYRVDADRVYLTGLSMGGFGSWALAAAHPEVFAAIAPICGGGNPRDASRIKDLPIWVFHGAKDPTVALALSEQMVKALKEAGAGEVKFTVYPDAGHDSWTETYNNPELYEWMLKHTRKK